MQSFDRFSEWTRKIFGFNHIAFMKWTRADKRRRWFGLFYLLVALTMLIWGQTLLKSHLKGLAYLLYWLAVFVLTFLAMATAMLDMWIIRLRQRQSENEAVQKAIKGLGKENAENADADPCDVRQQKDHSKLSKKD